VQALRLTPTAFSVLFAAVMLGQMAGGFAGSRLVVRLGIPRMVQLGTMIVLVTGALLAILVHSGVVHWSAIVLPMLGYILGCALLLPNVTAAALTPFPGIAGAASSLLGVLPFALGAIVSALLGAAFDGTARPLALAVALAGAGSFACERLLFAPVARATRAAQHG
jgi:DHA1 family bicyclomycin/chloramphenicol resistance-like MFS transporter